MADIGPSVGNREGTLVQPSPPDARSAKNGRSPRLGPAASRRTGLPMSTGHYRLADGSLVRVDIELGAWVGRLYASDMKVKDRIRGGDAEIRAWLHAMVGSCRFE